MLKYQIHGNMIHVYNRAQRTQRVIKIIILENEHSSVIKYRFAREAMSSTPMLECVHVCGVAGRGKSVIIDSAIRH